MRKFVFALIATVAATWMLAGSVTSTSAHGSHHGCNCGPTSPTMHYRTMHVARNYTKYHDVSVYKHVHRIHRVVTVTRVQPIVRIREITRVHHHTIIETRNAYEHVTERLPPIRYIRRSVQNYYDCECERY